MAFDKHKLPAKEKHEHQSTDDNKLKKKKPFGEGSNTDKGNDGDKGRNLDAYDKEQKADKELGEKHPSHH